MSPALPLSPGLLFAYRPVGAPKCCAVRVRVQLIEVIDDADVDKLYLISQFISGRSLMKDEQASVADEPN